MKVDQFKEKLSKLLKIKQIDLVINENRSTMLNLLDRKRDRARLSMHKMFLDAPEDVISAIAHYVRGTRRDRSERDLLIRGYIQQNLSRFDYSHLIDRSKLVTKGEIYDLAKMYREINRSYFEGKLQLQITWYGHRIKKRRRRVIFGQYYDSLKLIKIHRMMDDPFFPDYFVEFIVYHEMLHSVVPGYIDAKNGCYRSHGQEFKQKEREFHHYERAIEWEKKNKNRFLR